MELPTIANLPMRNKTKVVDNNNAAREKKGMLINSNGGTKPMNVYLQYRSTVPKMRATLFLF